MARLIAGILFTLLFAAAAWVQRNDADQESVFWISAYAAVAVMSLMFALRVLPRVLAWPVAGAALAVAVALALQQYQSGEPWNPEDQFLAEKVRESGGLALAGVWLLAAGAFSQRSKSS